MGLEKRISFVDYYLLIKVFRERVGIFIKLEKKKREKFDEFFFFESN